MKAGSFTSYYVIRQEISCGFCLKQLSGFISGSPTRIVETYFSPGPSPTKEERKGSRSAREGRGKVKDETSILHTLILYHSKVYALCEGVKDFSLKVYGRLCRPAPVRNKFAPVRDKSAPVRDKSAPVRFIPGRE
jgi:hypothetical protein